jgi:hypothetical protein
MKKFSAVFTLLMLTGFTGVVSSASLSFNPGQTPTGSSITDNAGSTISAQFGFGHDGTNFTHSYNFTSSDASSTILAQVNQLPFDAINFTSITFDDVQMVLNSVTNTWLGNGKNTTDHSIVLMGNQVTEGSQYSLTANSSESAPNAVPVPAAIWLFGSALAGLLGIKTRKTNGNALTA